MTTLATTGTDLQPPVHRSPFALPPVPGPPLAAIRPTGTVARLRLRLWHRLLTPGWIGPTPAARLRGWARVLDWAAASAGGRRTLLKRAIWRPVRAWKQAGAHVRGFGAEIAAASGVSPRSQRWQLWWLAVRHGLNAHSYRIYQLYRPERRRRAASFVQEVEFYRVTRWYNRLHADSDFATMMDKLRFGEWCSAHGLPSVPTLVEYDHGERIWSALPGDPARSLPAADLFQKPADGTGGHGTEIWRYVGDGAEGPMWQAQDGRTRTAPALLAEVAETSRTLPTKHGRTPRRILLQRRLRNHRDLLPLTPGALCTLRVVTSRRPDGAARVILAAHKLARAGAAGDNTDLGGISAPMDLTTGRLGSGVGPHGMLRVTFERHPDTGAVITGTVVPFWREAVELAVRAHDAARRLASIGWDIAITDDGPILLEGNPSSNPGIAQAPTGVPLSDTGLVAEMDAHVRHVLGI